MVTIPGREVHERGFDMVTVAPLSEAVGAIAIIVLSIIGLAGTAPETMLAIATIVIGAAILMQGANTASEYADLLTVEETHSAAPAGVGGGVTLEFLAGGAGVVLGILALLTPPTLVLTAAAGDVSDLLGLGFLGPKPRLAGHAIIPAGWALPRRSNRPAADWV